MKTTMKVQMKVTFMSSGIFYFIPATPLAPSPREGIGRRHWSYLVYLFINGVVLVIIWNKLTSKLFAG